VHSGLLRRFAPRNDGTRASSLRAQRSIQLAAATATGSAAKTFSRAAVQKVGPVNYRKNTGPALKLKEKSEKSGELSGAVTQNRKRSADRTDKWQANSRKHPRLTPVARMSGSDMRDQFSRISLTLIPAKKVNKNPARGSGRAGAVFKPALFLAEFCTAVKFTGSPA
jgi:hypothetical protein